MYFAYFWGCNKYKPTLMAVGTELDDVKSIVSAKAGSTTFVKMIDLEKSMSYMKDFDASIASDYIHDFLEEEEIGEEEIDKESQIGDLSIGQAKIAILHGKFGEGPANSMHIQGEDYLIKTEHIFKLMDSYGVWAPKCSCSCRISLFYIEDTKAIDAGEMLDSMAEMIN